MLKTKYILCNIVTVITLVGIMAFYGNTHKGKMKGTNTMKIRIGKSIFTARLYDNAAAKAFSNLLPITVVLTELNGNEKYADLPTKLPVDSHKPNMIKDGDIMLFGSATLVLFYKSFATPYSYTRLGKVDDTSGLEDALGSGNVEITFEH